MTDVPSEPFNGEGVQVNLMSVYTEPCGLATGLRLSGKKVDISEDPYSEKGMRAIAALTYETKGVYFAQVSSADRGILDIFVNPLTYVEETSGPGILRDAHVSRRRYKKDHLFELAAFKISCGLACKDTRAEYDRLNRIENNLSMLSGHPFHTPRDGFRSVQIASSIWLNTPNKSVVANVSKPGN